MTVYYGEVHNYDHTLEFGNTFHQGIRGRYKLTELHIREERLETFETLFLNEQIFEKALENGEVIIDNVHYGVLDQIEEFINGDLVKTLKMKVIHDKDFPVTTNLIQLRDINEKMQYHHQQILNDVEKRYEEKLENDHGRFISLSSENSSLLDDNNKLKDKNKQLKVILIALSAITLVLGVLNVI